MDRTDESRRLKADSVRQDKPAVGANFDLWFGDVQLFERPARRRPAAASPRVVRPNTWIDIGTAPTAPMPTWDPSSSIRRPPTTHVRWRCRPTAASTSTPSGPAPPVIRPRGSNRPVTPHALWLWDLSGASYPGALNDVVIGRRSNVNMRYEILDDAAAGFGQIHEGAPAGARATTPPPSRPATSMATAWRSTSSAGAPTSTCASRSSMTPTTASP